MTTKTAPSRLKATNNYRNKALANVALVISQHDKDIFDALTAIQAHYGDNRAKAIKQAILSHAKALELI